MCFVFEKRYDRETLLWPRTVQKGAFNNSIGLLNQLLSATVGVSIYKHPSSLPATAVQQAYCKQLCLELRSHCPLESRSCINQRTEAMYAPVLKCTAGLRHAGLCVFQSRCVKRLFGHLHKPHSSDLSSLVTIARTRQS